MEEEQYVVGQLYRIVYRHLDGERLTHAFRCEEVAVNIIRGTLVSPTLVPNGRNMPIGIAVVYYRDDIVSCDPIGQASTLNPRDCQLGHSYVICNNLFSEMTEPVMYVTAKDDNGLYGNVQGQNGLLYFPYSCIIEVRLVADDAIRHRGVPLRAGNHYAFYHRSYLAPFYVRVSAVNENTVSGHMMRNAEALTSFTTGSEITIHLGNIERVRLVAEGVATPPNEPAFIAVSSAWVPPTAEPGREKKKWVEDSIIFE